MMKKKGFFCSTCINESKTLKWFSTKRDLGTHTKLFHTEEYIKLFKRLNKKTDTNKIYLYILFHPNCTLYEISNNTADITSDWYIGKKKGSPSTIDGYIKSLINQGFLIKPKKINLKDKKGNKREIYKKPLFVDRKLFIDMIINEYKFENEDIEEFMKWYITKNFNIIFNEKNAKKMVGDKYTKYTPITVCLTIISTILHISSLARESLCPEGVYNINEHSYSIYSKCYKNKLTLNAMKEEIRSLCHQPNVIKLIEIYGILDKELIGIYKFLDEELPKRTHLTNEEIRLHKIIDDNRLIILLSIMPFAWLSINFKKSSKVSFEDNNLGKEIAKGMRELFPHENLDNFKEEYIQNVINRSTFNEELEKHIKTVKEKDTEKFFKSHLDDIEKLKELIKSEEKYIEAYDLLKKIERDADKICRII
ncbi:MAG: hypothetical protein KJ697_03985 [Nanoarchaeota archaeon]|nr:hypothetical protein [Nanoarchaeota archaeon]